MFRTAFEPVIIFNTVLIMMFKDIITSTGVIHELPVFFGSLPIPMPLVFALIFFFGTIVAGSQAMIVAVYANGHGNRKQRGGPVPVRPAHVHQLCCNAGLTGSHLPDALRRGLPGSAVIHGCEDHADGLRVYSHIVSILRLIEIRWALDGIIARCQKPNKETNSRRHAAACCSVKS